MEKIDLENADDAILREKLFVKVATKHLRTLEFKMVEEGYDGELMRSRKEIEEGEKDRQRKAEKMIKRHSEMRLKKKSRDRELDSDDIEGEEFIAPMLSRKETRRKNKGKHFGKKSFKRKQMKKRQKRHRH
ncbi:uncharacterized protein Eint_081640 [Encephalitozoon intestinalis ATCC 50506]|uniref:Uncharacterized protein n=1 Tax=Encephalitozoon intestinalis (strain ATCC 50506) TaxID=876142 RepID=E0S8Q8_ENCIT|nr:uncharacterized protein Eint_081640 [Encephalitozoon intestinalis ATCC 50506]ADM12096.1 hypothetical protein Eint_081640 [Encephalitozoon intestinalis ATCC 50506]UTX45889.1 hypothetical protein GPK93_08g14680 [Encephalitozoon intestinalis]